uniref:Uncharacterized protein n=1 Tax=Rhizophora mucronata TaxID=61149 RepID=A0A2P2QH60_RHIMU
MKESLIVGIELTFPNSLIPKLCKVGPQRKDKMCFCDNPLKRNNARGGQNFRFTYLTGFPKHPF